MEKLPKFVHKYVRSCVTCARAKSSSRQRIFISPNECPLGPFHSITMDFITNLPEVDGMSQILVVVDRFTKKIFTMALKGTATAIDVARALYTNIFRDHGLPLQIISDRDAKFTSKIWKNLHEIYKTTLTMGYAYHQRFDGLTEAMNRVLEEVIRCNINYTQTNWLDLLPEATAAINNSVDPNTNKSANNVYLGRRLFLPVDLAHGLVDAIPTVKEYLLGVEAVRHVAAEGVRKAIVRYTSDFNKHASLDIDPRLKIGAKVMLKAHNITQPGHHQRKGQKLQDKNLGVLIP